MPLISKDCSNILEHHILIVSGRVLKQCNIDSDCKQHLLYYCYLGCDNC